MVMHYINASFSDIATSLSEYKIIKSSMNLSHEVKPI